MNPVKRTECKGHEFALCRKFERGEVEFDQKPAVHGSE